MRIFCDEVWVLWAIIASRFFELEKLVVPRFQSIDSSPLLFVKNYTRISVGIVFRGPCIEKALRRATIERSDVRVWETRCPNFGTTSYRWALSTPSRHLKWYSSLLPLFPTHYLCIDGPKIPAELITKSSWSVHLGLGTLAIGRGQQVCSI